MKKSKHTPRPGLDWGEPTCHQRNWLVDSDSSLAHLAKLDQDRTPINFYAVTL